MPGTVKTLFILTFTADPMNPETLRSVVSFADNMLQRKNPAFASIMQEQMLPGSRIEIANIQYAGPSMHTPENMQTTLQGWLKRQYNVEFRPEINQNFFPQGMRDPQGRDNFFLFYFDMEP
jgi:hypothetical protein